MSSGNYPGLEAAVEAFIAREGSITPLRIREVIRAFRSMPMCDIPDDEAEFLARSIEVRYDVTMKLGPVLTERGYRPWLESVKADVDFYYWGRYRKLLQEKHFSPQVLSTIHEDTDRTLGLLENPLREGPWNRRGLVMGHVQSGKTANYIGLICKAADAGYRLIVVIAGVHNNLRNQTQKRIDEGFVGRDSARMLSQREERHIGVGRFDPARRPVTFTNSVRDFNKTTATGVGIPLHNLNEPVVFVIKKNPSTLKNLLEWLREHNASHGNRNVMAPMLLIDDEADNASINVRHGKGEVSRINGQIRELLQMFVRSCYVGYTATPFANIFIDPDTDDEMRGADLFPRHFIVSIDPPSSYFGAERVFREDSEAIVRHIEDNEDLLPLRHTIEHIVRALPPSLISAIHTFVVARAIRLHRGHEGQHCSMLVNASRFTGVQGQIRNEIQRRVEDLQASIRLNCALPSELALRDPEISELNGVWRREYANSGTSWEEAQKHLHDAAAPIKVVEVNCRAHGTLNYDQYVSTGLSVIAVGGFALSRGLTLEGLMVSYFLRNSMMYDTLMQMGRWFGYRPGYDDLCRVWMPEEAEGWYAHIAESIEMLRDELRTMAAAGATPEEFGLKVRAHPDTLIVTARNKMGSGEPVIVHIGLGTAFIETTALRNDKGSLAGNRNVARLFAASLAGSGTPVTQARPVPGGWLLSSVPVGPIRGFIGAFVNHPLSLTTETGPVLRYIEDREESELSRWDVLLAGIGNAEGTIVDTSLGIPINCQQRTSGQKSDATTIRVTNKQRVASRGVEKTGLGESDILEAEREYRKDQGVRPDGRAQRNYPDHIYRKKRKRPLLIIHMLRMLKDGQPMHSEPVVAWSISFPPTQHPEKRVTYIVNATWLQENFRDDVDDEEMEGDDV